MKMFGFLSNLFPKTSSLTTKKTPSKITANLEILENRDCPTVSITPSLKLFEGQSKTFTISVDSKGTFPAYVDISTYNESAVAGSDYNTLSTRVYFARGQQAKQYTIIARQDSIVENDENFYIKIDRVSSGQTIDPLIKKCFVTISDLTNSQLVNVNKTGTIPADIQLSFKSTQTNGSIESVDRNLHFPSVGITNQQIAIRGWSQISSTVNVFVTIKNSGIQETYVFRVAKTTTFNVSINFDTSWNKFIPKVNGTNFLR